MGCVLAVLQGSTGCTGCTGDLLQAKDDQALGTEDVDLSTFVSPGWLFAPAAQDPAAGHHQVSAGTGHSATQLLPVTSCLCLMAA